MFSKIVPAFSTDNIGTLGWYRLSVLMPMLTNCTGPLFLVAFIYEGLGLLLAFIVKQFFWVPHRFRYGILVAGGWGNYGDIRECRDRPRCACFWLTDMPDSHICRYEYNCWAAVQ